MSISIGDDSPTARLLNNDPELRHLYLSSDIRATSTEQELQALIHSMPCSQHLCHVYFRNFKLAGDGLNRMERLLAAMKTVPHLESLLFHCTEVPLELLRNILKASSNPLTALGLRYCKLRYRNEDEFLTFQEVLRSNASLKDVCIECCEWQVEEEQDGRRRQLQKK